MSHAIERITILGGGTAGWLAAGMLLAGRNRRSDRQDLEVTLIESPRIPTVGVGEATTISMTWALDLMAIDETDFMKTCDASLKAGVQFNGWDVEPDGRPSSYFHPFEAPPPLYGYSPAYHYHRRKREGADLPDLAEAMSPLVALLQQYKAPRRLDSGNLEGLASYAYHVDASIFAAYLKDYCTSLGVHHILDDVVRVNVDERGFVSSLDLKEGGAHPIEFIVDCSGFAGEVIRKTYDEPFIRYGDNLPCDRAVALQIPHEDDAPMKSYTTSTALGAGWVWQVPLFSRLGTGYVFSSAHRSDDEAVDEFLAHVGPRGKDKTPRVIRMNVGRSRRSWINNCVAIGLASGFVEPLESTSIHFVQMSIRWLLDNFPDKACSPPLRDQYNRLVGDLYEEIRDFIVMHYATSNRDDTAFWTAARHDLVVPDRLKERLALWRHKMPSAADLPNKLSLFSEWNYIYVLYGKHFFDGLDFAAEDAIGDFDFDEFRSRVIERRIALVEAAPDHREFLRVLRATETAPWYRPEPLPATPGGAAAIA